MMAMATHGRPASRCASRATLRAFARPLLDFGLADSRRILYARHYDAILHALITPSHPLHHFKRPYYMFEYARLLILSLDDNIGSHYDVATFA